MHGNHSSGHGPRAHGTDAAGTPAGRRGGVVAFGAVWFGQLVSVIGSSVTAFALGLWVYRTHGSLTDFALVGFAAVLPRVVLSPIAGTYVDRSSRRAVMLLTSGGGAIVSLALAVLVLSGSLSIWHVYVAAAVNGALASFEWPAWSAATTSLVPARHLGRASGLVSLSQAASDIVGPVLAAILLTAFGIELILAIDVASFGFACIALALVRFPEPAVGIAARLDRGFGVALRFIRSDAGLTSLVVFMASVTFEWGIVGALIVPVVLGFSSQVELGQVVSIAGLGALTGSIFMTVTGGGRRRMAAIIVAEAVSGAAFVGMGLATTVAVVAPVVFVAHVTIPIIAGSTQVLWQERVPADLLGRVFAARQMIERALAPLAFLVAGPLAERFFNPALASDNPVGSALRALFGAGDARGAAAMFALMGVVQIAIAGAAIASARIRDLDGVSAPVPGIEDAGAAS